MGIDNPRINNNGQGLWADSPSVSGGHDDHYSGGNPAIGKNALQSVGSNAAAVSDFNKGSAGGGSASWIPGVSLSSDQGTGPANKPSPDQSLIGRANTDSPDQGTGPANKPSPDQSLVPDGNQKRPFTRSSSLGGVEQGVQIP